jgi:hypothetical protein
MHGYDTDRRRCLSTLILAPHQDRYTLRDGGAGFFPQDPVAVVANRMRDDGKGKARHARHLCHRLGRLHKPFCNDRRCRNTSLLGSDGVVQTARRTAASIPNGTDNCIALPHVRQDRGWRWPAGIGFA